MLPYTVGSSESSELSDPYGVWPCESLPNVGRSNCVWSSWVDCSGTVGSGGMLGMEGASGAGAACGVAGRPECTGRLERLASQVLRTDRSEFRKERHTGCRTECWWLPGLGRSAIRVCGGHCRSRRRHCRCRSGCRIRISGWRRNSRCVRVGDRCRSAVRGVLCGCGRWHARGWGVAVAGCRIVEACAGWIGLLGHEHNEHDRRGQACDETDDQQEYAGCASRARSATDYGNGAKSRHDEADAQQNATDEVNRVEDDQRGAGLVGVVQAANGKRKDGTIVASAQMVLTKLCIPLAVLLSMMAPNTAKMTANAIWMMNVHRTHHQNSPREARPLNVAYFFQKRMNASPMVQL